jgi:GNAT superfamily N-acetyltransferase
MDEVTNPFSPGAGSRPPELVGRDEILRQAATLLARTKLGRAEKSMMLTGLRGVGKTVLLNEIHRRAESSGYRTVLLEAHEDKALAALLVPALRSLLFELDRLAGMGDKVRRGLAVLRGFVGAIKVIVGEIELGLDVEPERGTADSGDLEVDLPGLFAAVAEAAQQKGVAVALLIDEVQYLKDTELSALIMAMHRLQQNQLPMVLVGAGLPAIPQRMGESKSYSERLFSYPEVGPLQRDEAYRAVRDPMSAQTVVIEEPALEAIFEFTKGYPYFLQEWGYFTWLEAVRSPISGDVVARATPKVIARLDSDFFRVRFNRLTPREKDYLRAMAELGGGPHRTGDVAAALGVEVTTASPFRASLIGKGMIYASSHGHVAFTVPLFDEFMRRAMPEFPAASE